MRVPQNPELGRIDTFADHELRPFIDLTQRVGKIVATEFKPVRADAMKDIAPTLIYSNQYVHEELSPAVVESMRNGFGRFAYNPLNHTVMCSRDAIMERLARGDLGIRNLDFIMAEEHTHAMTSRKIGKNIQIGMVQFAGKRRWHGLAPGGVYDFTSLAPAEPNVKSIDDAEFQKSVLVMERVTQLAVLGMAHILHPDAPSLYPFLHINANGIPLTFQGKDAIRKAAIKTLYTGDLNTFTKEKFPQTLLQILQADGIMNFELRPTYDALDLDKIMKSL